MILLNSSYSLLMGKICFNFILLIYLGMKYFNFILLIYQEKKCSNQNLIIYQGNLCSFLAFDFYYFLMNTNYFVKSKMRSFFNDQQATLPMLVLNLYYYFLVATIIMMELINWNLINNFVFYYNHAVCLRCQVQLIPLKTCHYSYFFLTKFPNFLMEPKKQVVFTEVKHFIMCKTLLVIR